MARWKRSPLLARNGLSPAAIRLWVAHLGGRRVMDNVQEALRLTDADLRFSRSASFPFRQHVVADRPVRAGGRDTHRRSDAPWDRMARSWWSGRSCPPNETAFDALLDLNMLVMTGGRERTGPEFRRLFDAAGLVVTRITPTPAPQRTIEDGGQIGRCRASDDQ